MGRPAISRSLGVWMNGERVGTWTVRPGRHDELSYDAGWLSSEAARPISLSLPLSPTPISGPVVGNWFDNLLPDNRELRTRIQRRYAVGSLDPFDLLAEVGRDCIGAIQLLAADEVPDVKRISGTPLSDGEIASLLEQTVTGAGATHDGDFRISLSGAQEKTALLRHRGKWLRPRGSTPTTHILKLPLARRGGGRGIDLSTAVENEWLCSRILAAYAMPVADCRIERFGEHSVLVVERFDRRLSSDRRWIIRLPQEDLCQALGVPPDRKYEADGGPGIRRIMDVLLGSSTAEEDRRDFFRTQMIFWLLCAIDGHGKNFSISIAAAGRYRLTPRYDVLSAFPVPGKTAGKLSPMKVRMAMAVDGRNRHYLWHSILPRHWEEMARRCGMRAGYASIRDEIVASTATVIDVVRSQIPKEFPDAVAGPILDGLKRTCDQLRS